VVDQSNTRRRLWFLPQATTAQASDVAYLSEAAPRHNVGAWTAIGMTELTLGPGEVSADSCQGSPECTARDTVEVLKAAEALP